MSPCVIKIDEGLYRMYYEARTANKNGLIKSAISFDGQTWKEEKGVRIGNLDFYSYGTPFCLYKNNIGYILNRQGKYNEAVIELLDAININPNFAEPYLNIGISFQNLNDNEKAIEYYKKALTLKKDFYDVYFNLGEIYKKINKPKEALNYYTKSKNRKTNEKLLECLFLLDLQKDYIELLNNIKKTDKNNRGISAISNYVANQFNISNPYNFCPNPIDFIYKVNLTKNINYFDKFLKKLLDEILKQSFAWEPYARTANKGYVTKGNLSFLYL